MLTLLSPLEGVSSVVNGRLEASDVCGDETGTVGKVFRRERGNEKVVEKMGRDVR